MRFSLDPTEVPHALKGLSGSSERPVTFSISRTRWRWSSLTKERYARTSRSSCAADAMHVVGGRKREIVVDDVADCRDIETVSGDVDRDQDGNSAVAELFQRRFACVLRDVAVNFAGSRWKEVLRCGKGNGRAII